MIAIRFLILALALGVATRQVAPAPASSPSSSARVAGVQFAMRQGWRFPSTNVVVAMEAHFGAVDGHPVPQLDAERTKEALEIAKLIGPDVKTGWAIQLLQCPQGAGRLPCYAKDVSVVVVGGLYVGQNDVGIQVYSPGATPADPSTMTHAVIDLERRGADWIGVRYRLGPSTLTRRGR